MTFHSFEFSLQSGLSSKKRVEESLAISAVWAEEKKHEQGCRRKHFMGSSNAQEEGWIITGAIDMFLFYSLYKSFFLPCRYVLSVLLRKRKWKCYGVFELLGRMRKVFSNGISSYQNRNCIVFFLAVSTIIVIIYVHINLVTYSI